MSDAVIAELQARIRAAAAAKSPLVIRGGGTKDFLGQSIAGDVARHDARTPASSTTTRPSS